MIEKINWDESLVKKYSSSNHFKLLNQLRNEVEKYPLNKKKNLLSDQNNDNKVENKNSIIKSSSQDTTLINNSNINNENNNKLTVSFNNSKNFSIYKNLSNDNNDKYKNLLEDKESNDKQSSTTFKDRLNQVDLK